MELRGVDGAYDKSSWKSAKLVVDRSNLVCWSTVSESVVSDKGRSLNTCGVLRPNGSPHSWCSGPHGPPAMWWLGQVASEYCRTKMLGRGVPNALWGKRLTLGAYAPEIEKRKYNGYSTHTIAGNAGLP